MRKIGWKTRLQWGFYVAAMFGIYLAVLFVPATGDVLGVKEDDKLANPVTAFLDDMFYGEKVKILLNGKPVAVARSMEEAKTAYKNARLQYNSKGIKVVDLVDTYEYVNKKEDEQLLKDNKVLKEDALEAALYNEIDNLAGKERQLAYTMRIDEYTVTMDSIGEIVEVLEKLQDAYDDADAFQISLEENENHNIAIYEVRVMQKEGIVLACEGVESANQQLKAQSADDGIKNLGFSDEITVMATVAKESRLTDCDTAYKELAEEKGEEAVYVIQPGDYLELIAEKNDMEVSEIKELNPQITSDEDLYYDDRLNVMSQEAVVSVMVEKQETYEENYYADIIYEDDDSMYIGENTIVQEGQEGTHIVTDMVTYKGEEEAYRQQIEETVEVEPIAQIVRRGTKSRPTYMYPVSNWNVTSTFGMRWGRLHAGTDVGIPTGTTVRASRSGQVVTAGWVGGYGNCVMIDHGDGIWTVYGHLSQILVSVGQYVDQGQQIALSGNTGRSTGPHLHFEIRVNGSATDATPYLEGRN